MSKVSFSEECLDYQKDIRGFINKLNFFNTYEDFQEQIIKLVHDTVNGDGSSLYVAVNGCKGGGKSCLSALLIIVILLTQPVANMVYFSGKKKQAVATLLAEVKSLINKSNYTREILEVLKITDEDIYNSVTQQKCHIFTSSNAADGGTGGGHGEGLNVVIYDEAPNINEKVFTHTAGMSANGTPIFLMLGNPEYVKGSYYSDVFLNDDDKWHKFNINYLELKCKSVVERQNMLKAYEVGSENYRKYVLGEFLIPKNSVIVDRKLIEPLVEKVQHSSNISIYHLDTSYYFHYDTTYVGIDIASGSSNDNTVIVARTGNVLEVVLVDDETDILQLKDIIINLYNKYSSVRKLHFIIDADGLGNCMPPILRNDPRSVMIPCTPLHNSVVKNVHMCYKNLRSQLYGQIAKHLNIASDIARIGQDELFNQGFKIFVQEPNIEDGVNTKLLLHNAMLSTFLVDEGKKKLTSKKYLTMSLDVLDAMAYTFYFKNTYDLY